MALIFHLSVFILSLCLIYTVESIRRSARGILLDFNCFGIQIYVQAAGLSRISHYLRNSLHVPLYVLLITVDAMGEFHTVEI